MAGDESDRLPVSIPDRAIASALEFAVGVAAHGARQQPPLACPVTLRRYFSTARLAPKALSAVRSAIEADPAFLEVLAETVRPSSVDEVGLLWIKRPDNWQQRIIELVGDAAPSSEADLDAAGRRFDRRREHAERIARDAQAETAALRAQQAKLAADAAAAIELTARFESELARLDAQLGVLRGEVERGRRAIEAAEADRRRLESALAVALARADAAEAVRDEVLAARVVRSAPLDGSRAVEVILEGAAAIASDLAAQAQTAERVADELRLLSRQLHELEPARRSSGVEQVQRPRQRRRARRPVSLPGEVYGRADLEGAFLARHPGMQIVVDGYNVAKLGWPQLDLSQQRDRCVTACEDVSRRYGSTITVVFDGASVPGASAPGRRLVAVRFSPDGVLADDVIRAIVDQLPDEVPVLVVTNDQAVVSDVRSMGANVLSSEVLLGLSGR